MFRDLVRRLCTLRLAVALAAPALVLVPATAQAATGPLDAATMDQVSRGEVVVHLGDGSGVRAVTAAGLVDASPERVWAVLTDPVRYASLFPNIRKSTVVGRGEGFEDKVSVVDYPWPLGSRWVKTHVVYGADRRTITWRRLDGSIRVSDGRWQLLAGPGGKTLLVYQAQVDPGVDLVPSSVVTNLTGQLAPAVVRAVRQAVKALPSSQAIASTAGT